MVPINRIKKNKFREPYPSLFEYPYQIPTHHTVVKLDNTEQQELKEEKKQRQDKYRRRKVRKKLNQLK